MKDFGGGGAQELCQILQPGPRQLWGRGRLLHVPFPPAHPAHARFAHALLHASLSPQSLVERPGSSSPPRAPEAGPEARGTLATNSCSRSL